MWRSGEGGHICSNTPPNAHSHRPASLPPRSRRSLCEHREAVSCFPTLLQTLSDGPQLAFFLCRAVAVVKDFAVANPPFSAAACHRWGKVGISTLGGGDDRPAPVMWALFMLEATVLGCVLRERERVSCPRSISDHRRKRCGIGRTVARSAHVSRSRACGTHPIACVCVWCC